jgi:serine/threonine protein kinase
VRELEGVHGAGIIHWFVSGYIIICFSGIKAENILLQFPYNNANFSSFLLKISGFSLSQEETLSKKFCGTPIYMVLYFTHV